VISRQTSGSKYLKYGERERERGQLQVDFDKKSRVLMHIGTNMSKRKDNYGKIPFANQSPLASRKNSTVVAPTTVRPITRQ
jgi:hypothetical protein